jgi:fructokinase
LLQQIAALDSTDEIMEQDELLFQMVGKANIAGAITTTNYGAIASLPDQKQLQDFV